MMLLPQCAARSGDRAAALIALAGATARRPGAASCPAFVPVVKCVARAESSELLVRGRVPCTQRRFLAASGPSSVPPRKRGEEQDHAFLLRVLRHCVTASSSTLPPDAAVQIRGNEGLAVVYLGYKDAEINEF